ncbi:sensor domain-containing diguanylate cyclase [Hyphomicrobium sp.]|uniref:sensor domain-containing diguanylate cyclase n=1 Tax=Hyphomicrobium sp. TaxID=82 RepID=UPI002E3019A1|nr:diguanylate cyclase [Hyphomicrobium sp.]HEX2843122.1 diguanylate cyclase [Hyphomicrobium sp.]
MTSIQGSNGGALVRWIGLAIGLPALIAVVLLGKDTLMVIEKINEDALKRETAALERGMKMLGELHASQVLQQTLWDEAFRNIVVSKRQSWIQEYFGTDAISSNGMQQLIIVEPDGKASFSSKYNAAPPPDQVAGLLAAAAAPMERSRQLYRLARASGEGFDERMPGAMTDGIYVNDFITVDGHPAMITVSPITPDDEKHATPAEPTLVLGIQTMTEPLLDRLETLSHIDGLEHVTAEHEARTGEHVHEVRDANGNMVTRVTWDFSSPGYEILWAAMPAIALSLGLIAMMTTFAAVTVRRLTRKLSESEQAALYASRHDTATGLANRGWFMRVFAGLLGPVDGPNKTHAVLLIDCDYFKSVNDTLGHAAGDAVLVAISERLKALKERIAIAARLGGDEFALVTSPLARADEALSVVQEIEQALMRPVVFETHVIPVSVSIGAVTVETPSTLSIDAWLAKADMALYRAKRDGRGCSRLYDPAVDAGESTVTANACAANDQRSKVGRAA